MRKHYVSLLLCFKSIEDQELKQLLGTIVRPETATRVLAMGTTSTPPTVPAATNMDTESVLENGVMG